MAGTGNRSEMRHLLQRVFRDRQQEPLLRLGLLRQHWAGVVGPELAARTQPHRLEGATLWIATPDACWAYELQFFKSELLASVQAFLESRAVTDLRFRAVPAEAGPTGSAGGTSPPAGPPPEPAPMAGGSASAGAGLVAQAFPGSPPQPPEALARAAEAISDPALRAVFQRSLSKRRRAREDGDSPPDGE